MRRKAGTLRPSPNEEARLVREEHERRRKLRIQQVREQQRYIALQIRREVEQRRRRELEQLEEQLRDDWERQQRDKLQKLQDLYRESLQLLGQGHRSAKENEPDLAAKAQRDEENHTKAEQRYREALKELKSQKLKDHERSSRSIDARRKALQAEKERSAKVASLPPPPPNPIQNIESKKPHMVKKSDVSVFAATHYHMSESMVDREVDTEQPSAHEGAELELRRLQDFEREERRRREEQLEKARLRGREALRREHLVQDRERLLVELEHMQQTDLLRRRQQVSQMPPQIFQPLYKRQETREDFQRDMEFAFEDMYTGERRVKGDLVVQLVPEPLPALSTGSQDQELDVTLDETEQHDTEQETSAQAEPLRPAPRRALKRLLDRIRIQRSQLTDHNSHVPAADSLTAITDQIPERDTTMDTGSLTSEDKLSSTEAARSAADLKTAERSADTRPPAREFEEERKQREEALEQEKQQQLVLLQELEEHKVKLEHMLIEAQLERDHLKAAVTQEGPINQTEVPVQDQEDPPVSSAPATELAPSAGEDEHSRRVRDYQQRLLDQSRIHQRLVEVARQRLEEYQRALRIRYNMTTTPPGLTPPPLHGAQSVHPPAHLQLHTDPAGTSYTRPKPQTSVDFPTRESDMLTSRPRLPDEVEPVSNRNQRPDPPVWLTDHLSVRARPPSVSMEPQKHTTHHATSNPLQSDSDPIQAPSQTITDHVLLFPRRAAVKPGSLQQRRELQEVQSRMLDHREAVVLRRRQEVEMEQMRRQKETLQALIQTEDQPVPEDTADVLDPEDVSQTRLRLLASLLRAIEETNGGTLSHLEDRQETDVSPQSPPPHSQTGTGRSVGLSMKHFSSQIRAGPVPASVPPPGLLPPPRAAKPPVTRVRPGVMEVMTEQHELSVIPEVETPADSSRVTGPEDSVLVPSHVVDWDLSVVSDGTLQTPSWSSSEQQTAERPTGSGTNSRRSRDLIWRERLLMGTGTSPESSESDSVLRIVSPLSSDSGRGEDFSGPAVRSFRSPSECTHRRPDSDWLSSTTISTGSYISSDPELNADKTPPLRPPVGRGPGLLDVSSPSAQSVCAEDRSGPGLAVGALFNDSSIQHIIERYTRELNRSLCSPGRTSDSDGSRVEEPGSPVFRQSLVGVSERMGEDESSAGGRSLPSDSSGTQRSLNQRDWVNPVLEHVSLEDPDQDSFRPLIGQLTNQSSCLAADRRDSVLERLVGHPSAHSSLIGQLPGPPVSVSVDHGGWDSTLSRMIGRLSHQSSSHWLSGGRDFYAAQLMGQVTERSTMWLDEGPEESRMRPLVGELDESTGQQSGSSAERTHVALGVSAETSMLSYPALPPEASSHSASAPLPSPHPRDQTLQSQTSPDLDPEGTGDSDPFLPLPAEVTHNETADPSVTFDPPEHRRSTSEESEPSPEHLRPEETRSASPPSQESFSQLITSHIHHESAGLSALSLCDEGPSSDLLVPVSEDLLGAAGEKGILEQSEITLVSLTDTTLQDQDQETTYDEEGLWEDKHPDGVSESLLLDQVPEDQTQTHPVTLQEVYQQKRRILLQRSACRVEEIRTKAQPETQTPLEARDLPKTQKPLSGTCKTRTTSEPQRETKSKGGQAELHLKICTPDQRRRDVSEMHQRTRRLYEQLEEVKQQRAARSRQERSAENRLKAKEFTKKTLQKLRGQQTQ